MVVSLGRLDGIVPLEPASMEDRTIVQWDKDDCDALKIVKQIFGNDSQLPCTLLVVDEIQQFISDKVQRAHDVQEIKRAVKKLKEEHALAILLVEQYVDFCREVADRFYAMDRGVVVVSGTIDTLTDEVVKKHLQV